MDRWLPLHAQLALAKDIGMQVAVAQRVFGKVAGQRKALRPVGPHGRPDIELRQGSQLGAGMAAPLHAPAFIATGLCPQQTATAVKVVPAQGRRGLQPGRWLPASLAVDRRVVEPRIAIIQCRAGTPAIQQSIPVAIVRGLAHLLQAQHPVQLARRQKRLAAEIQPRSQHAAVVALLALHPGGAARAREPAHKILLRAVDKTQQPGICIQCVLRIQAQRAKVLVGTITHHAAVLALWVLPPLRFGQIAGRVATRLVPATG